MNRPLSPIAHRARIRFVDEPPAAGDTPPTGGAAAAPPAGDQSAGTTPPAGAPAGAPAPKTDPWEDPAAARAEIERLRRENAAERTNAKAKAAEEARAELAQSIGKALGLVKDDEPVDPAKLTEQVSSSQAEARQARVELAVYRSAAEAGGDPAALLDSASFLASLSTIDPTDTAAITEAIKSAVGTNSRLAAVAGARTPAPNPGQGAATKPPTAEELAAQAAANGDWKKAAALKADQLLTLSNATTNA
ncbi:hypothetical protein GCM10022215_29810 [Nocardioides fonticola]|uniref:Scaffolding protein n=1 Tax=Nocardioides fonticola TaxID=450363 RepID=A0ABP7XPK7_9ACTN